MIHGAQHFSALDFGAQIRIGARKQKAAVVAEGRCEARSDLQVNAGFQRSSRCRLVLIGALDFHFGLNQIFDEALYRGTCY